MYVSFHLPCTSVVLHPVCIFLSLPLDGSTSALWIVSFPPIQDGGHMDFDLWYFNIYPVLVSKVNITYTYKGL